MRADQLLVHRGIATSRSQAQRVLAAGSVLHFANAAWRPLAKGADLADDAQLKLVNADELKFVSRGGLKLEGALAHTQLSLQGKTVLDVGQSTGGFTDCALQSGAVRVVGVDVGHGQLTARLKNHAQVVSFEGVNARALLAADLGTAYPAAGFDAVVGDVSFISLTLILPAISALLADEGHLLFLVKPQFELQPEQLSTGGIVRDAALYAVVEARIRSACAECGLLVRDFFPSPITGGDGNREFFLWAVRDEETQLTRAAMIMSAPSFAKAWDNPEDDIYNAIVTTK
jgi:23S rRNA (cytidine1920-2'-O)/16S rRNA (cytidine1409-2'-O)-methyltransferase